jgi:SAM-dependent methyltransferase
VNPESPNASLHDPVFGLDSSSDAPGQLSDPEGAVQLVLPVTQPEIATVFEPFVSDRLTRDDPRWIDVVNRKALKVERKLLKAKKWSVHLSDRPRGMTPREPVTDPDQIRARAVQWLVENYGPRGNFVPVEFGEQPMLARGVGVSRVHLLLLMRLVALTDPKTVLEVGSGNGINLFALAARYPDIEFTGLEINPDGIARTEAVRRITPLHETVCVFSPDEVRDSTAHSRTRFVNGTGRRLPFRDNTFDLVFSRQALEQMHDLQDEAIAELGRVSRRWVGMIEAFREWNSDGFRRKFVLAHQYFDAGLSDLEPAGLFPILSFDAIPHKIGHFPVLVLAEKNVGSG